LIRYNHSDNSMVFWTNTSEQMRLTSTGLGIGTSSPGSFGRLAVLSGSTSATAFFDNTVASAYSGGSFFAGPVLTLRTGANATGNATGIRFASNANGALEAMFGVAQNASTYGDFVWQSFNGSYGERMRLDSSGNLGLGVTPNAGWAGYKAIQVGTGASFGGYTADVLAFVGSNCYNDNSNWRYLANGNVATRYQQSGGVHQWYSAPSGTAGNAITFTQAMTLDTSGNLGVGETSPSFGLGSGVQVTRSGIATLRLQNSAGSNSFELAADSTANGVRFYGLNNAPFIFSPNATERARITSGGDLLVGTTSSAQNANNGLKFLPGGAVYVVNNGGTDGFSYYNTTAGAYRFYVQNNGTIAATNTTIAAISDQRLKENIQDLDVGLDKIMALKPRKFDWKAGKGKDIKGDRGWIAQEFEQVFPDMVDEWKDSAPEGEEPYKSVRADLIPVLVKAIQELKAEVDSLKAQLKGA